MEPWVELGYKIVDEIERGAGLVVVFAPTGFGKTMSSPYLLEEALRRGLATRLIHVVPNRALLREIYSGKFRELGEKLGLNVAYQSMDRIPGALKSPYFLSDLIVTTLESFLLNIYKFPPVEVVKVAEGRSQGHYYPSIAALLTSIVVLDEAHIYVGEYEDRYADLVISAIKALAELKVPVVLETATISIKLLRGIAGSVTSNTSILYVCPEGVECPQLERLKMLKEFGSNVNQVPLASNTTSVKWATRIANSYNEAVREAREMCREKVVLFITNTVDKAVETYKMLKDDCSSTLIHSRLKEGDKVKALSKVADIKNEGRGLIVASPIVEVGVDIDADVLVSEIAPVENIVQRAGRLCRDLRRRGGGCDAQVVLFSGDSGFYNETTTSKTFDELMRIGNLEWRALWNTSNGVTYAEILDSVYQSLDIGKPLPYQIFENIVKNDIRPLMVSERELEPLSVLEEFKSLSLVKILVGSENSDLDEEYVLMDLSQLKYFEKNMRCLERSEEGSVRVALVTRKGGSMHVKSNVYSTVLAKALEEGRFRLRTLRQLGDELFKSLDEEEYLIDYFLVARRECYKEGLGIYVE